MRTLLKVVLAAASAAILTTLLLIIVLDGIVGMQWSRTLQILSSATGLYLLPAIIFIEFYLLTNDLLAYACRRYELDFGLHFSEIPFKFDLDNFETPIRLRRSSFSSIPSPFSSHCLGSLSPLSRANRAVPGPLRVKQRRTQNEQMRSAVPQIADIKGPDRVLSR